MLGPCRVFAVSFEWGPPPSIFPPMAIGTLSACRRTPPAIGPALDRLPAAVTGSGNALIHLVGEEYADFVVGLAHHSGVCFLALLRYGAGGDESEAHREAVESDGGLLDDPGRVVVMGAAQ